MFRAVHTFLAFEKCTNCITARRIKLHNDFGFQSHVIAFIVFKYFHKSFVQSLVFEQ